MGQRVRSATAAQVRDAGGTWALVADEGGLGPRLRVTGMRSIC